MTSIRYDDIGTVNSVKLISKIDSYNGYIQLYTQLDSHIEVGDTVFITYSGDTSELGDLNLDNTYYILQKEDFLYDNYAQGYEILYVNKNINSFVINRFIYTIPTNSKIYGHYVSTVSANNINITGGKIDGTLIKNGTMNNSTNEINIIQLTMLYGQISNINIKNKYLINYISLLLDYNENNNTYIKYSNLNNNKYGYSYFYNIQSILNCDLYYGLYFNSTISTSLATKKINGGFYSNCYINNYEIYNGYMKNTTLSNNCLWYYGSWDGEVFELDNWFDGIFINGTFGKNNNAIWESGTFYNGIWSGLYWFDGDFIGGEFKGQDNFINGEGQITYTEWLSGNFIDGKMYNDDFYTGNGNSFYIKDINITGGEIYNASIHNGTINGGKIYNSSIKNCDIYNGDFIANLENVDYKYNRISNCNIYDGNFIGEWWEPIYLNSNSSFTDSKYGLNEISESIIYNGNFKYTQFYNYNEIKNGIYDNCLFFSPINVNNGIFKNGIINNIKMYNESNSSYTITKTQKSNYFGSEKFNFSKAIIRKIELLNSSGDLVNKILLDFDNGHNFSSGDTTKTIQLTGFKSQELWNSEFTILSNNTCYDPTTYGTTGNTLPYEYFKSIGNTYVVLEENYKEWFYNDSGIVRKVDYYDYLSESNNDFYNIYNGDFSNCYMQGVEIPMQSAIDDIDINTTLARTNTRYGNIKIYFGNFKNSYLQNGIIWLNGKFNGGEFISKYGVENHWFNGNFYNGIFGDNLGGDLKNMTLSIWDNNALIINKSGSTGSGTTDWILTKIYPLKHNIGEAVLTSASAFLSLNRNTITHTNNINFTYDDAKNTMNVEPWSDANINNISPYEFIFVIECSNSDANLKLKAILDTFNSNNNNYYIGIIDPNRHNLPIDINNQTYISEPYKLFERLYTDNYDYDYIDYYYNPNIEENTFYLRFRFNEIERLYANSTNDEFEHFNQNYRSVWSLANTGYYTYPMPVLYGENSNEDYYGNEDLLSVGKFIINGIESGIVKINDTDWIYGTCPPPWWYNVTSNNAPSISWSNAQVGTITKVSTKNMNNNTIINNNGKPVDYFIINSSDILQRLQQSWIMIDLYGDLSYNYPGDFKHINGVTTSRDSSPIPYKRKLVEWYRHYIYLNKNKSGFNFKPVIRFSKVHDESKSNQLLYDPYFNNVEDYKTEPIWDLGGIQEGRIYKSESEYNRYNRPSMIYNTKAYDAKLIGNKLYFNNIVNFNDRNKEDLFNFSNGWDDYIRIVKKEDHSIIVNQINFENDTYQINNIVKYSYHNGILENYIELKNDSRLHNNPPINVEVFKQNRGIIMPYYYKINSNNSNISSIISYKDYGEKISLRMEPIFHNYAFNGKSNSNSHTGNKTGHFDNRNIFGVRIIKLVPDDNGNIIKNNHYRIIFNSLYENPDQIFIRHNGSYIENEPIISAYSFYSNNLPLIEGPSYYVEPNDLLQSLRYSETDKNWISLLNLSGSNSYTYNNFLTENIFNGTFSISNSGLTETDENSYYNVAKESTIFAGNYVSKNRVYFDITDERLEINDIFYPSLLNNDSIFLTNIWNNTNTSTHEYHLPNIKHFTNNILNYVSGNSSSNYTRFSIGFEPDITNLEQLINEITGNSYNTQTGYDLQEMSLSSHTDFRLASHVNVNSTPSIDAPDGSIRFPDYEVNGTSGDKRTGAIWIKKPGAWEDFYNHMDRHYRLKLKIIRRLVCSGSSPSIIDNSNTRISVIFGDQIYTKTGDDLISENGFPTIEFEIYHHLIKGEDWLDNFIGVIIENDGYNSDTISEYYITEMTLDYDPFNYVDLFATLESQVECAGRILKVWTKYYTDIHNTSITKYKTISTKILDYDWLNKSYILDIDPNYLPYFNFNDIYLATNIRTYNNFNYSNDITEYGDFNNVIGYDNTKKWVLPPWNNNENPSLNDINISESIYQKNFINNFSKKDCMIDIKYSTNIKYLDGTGPSMNNNDYHDSMGDNTHNHPVSYNIIDINGNIKQTQMSLINLDNYDTLGKEYFDYGVLNSSLTYTINLFGFFDNVNYWFGPLKLSYGDSTVENSSIQDSEHPAYWKNGPSYYEEFKNGNHLRYGIYQSNTHMFHNYKDSDNNNYTYKYYKNATFNNNNNIVSVSDEYLYNNGNTPWNFKHLRGWKHIGRWLDTSLNNYWIHGSYEGKNNLECNYVDLFKTRPMSNSNLENISQNDGIEIKINVPNIYFSDTYDFNSDSIKRNVINSIKIVEKVTLEEFDTLSETTPQINYENYRIDGYNGMKKFGLQMWKNNDIFRIMSHNYLFNYNNYHPETNLVWYYDINDFTDRNNFHDIALFNAYHISKVDINNGYYTNYQDILFDEQLNNYNIYNSRNRTMYNMFNDMENNTNIYVNQYSEYFTNDIIEKFKNMNEYDQTSVQNFNKKSGIQIYTYNINISPSSYTDNWYDGIHYDGAFKGKWYSGKWIYGQWEGYNYIQASLPINSYNYYFNQLSAPDIINIGFVEKEPYEINYELLKRKKLYYDIQPWDEANNKKTEKVKLPLRKKNRKL